MKLNIYQKTAILTISATIFLILVGGLVRASGAGLGCPDWPKCYGLWIPPTSIETLPAAYNPAEFNAVKTWTEYVNRLIGVLIGLLITATFLFSFKYRKTRPSVTIASFAAFVMVLFQGWLGGQVVLSGLSEWVITLHMVMAMAIVGVLIFAAFKAMSDSQNTSFSTQLRIPDAHRDIVFWISIVLLGLTLVQMVLGTQVREAIDVISRAADAPDRSAWIYSVGIIDDIHRSFSWLVIASSAFMVWYSFKRKLNGYYRKLSVVIIVMILAQIVAGIVLAYMGMPPAFQVFHLVGSAILISAILLLVFSSREAYHLSD